MPATLTTPSPETMFRACSDRTRLRILHLLANGEFCVCDLVSVLGVPQPKASRHLAYLRRAGLVRARKQGLWQYYMLAPARSAFHRRLMQCLAEGARENPPLLKDLLRLAGRRCAGKINCCT